MLDRLGRSKKAGVKGWHALVLVHDLLAFVKNTLDRITRFAPRRGIDQFKDLLKPLNLAFGFVVMFFEGRAQFVGLWNMTPSGS